MNKQAVKLIFVSIFAVVLTSCEVKYNKIKFKDPNEGDKEIYGNIGGEPIQLANPAKPDKGQGEMVKTIAPKFREQIEAGLQH